MPQRISDYRELLFPVRSVPVFAQFVAGDETSRLRVPGRKAILDCSTNRVLSIVSENYRIVTNRDALDYAHQCCAAAFPDIPSRAWRVATADAPATGGHCHIDLVESTSKLKFDSVSPGNRPDTYGPFVRVTNSYNRTRALGFDIGFMRKVCSNGMIIPKSSVHFAFNHNTRNIGDRVRFEIKKGTFQGLRQRFLNFLEPLRQCHVPSFLLTPLALRALRVTEPRQPPGRGREAWEEINSRVDSLSRRYAGELGHNAYALTNVVSDIATRPADIGLRRRERNSLQRRAGEWLADFSSDCGRPAFDPYQYAMNLTEAVPGSGHQGAPSESSRPAVMVV